MRIDLHTHSSCSDGTDTPAQLMKLAGQADLDLLALTDHDTVAGWPEAAEQVKTSGVGLVRGAEFSTSHDLITAHILGYLFDPNDQDIQRLFAQVKESRIARLREMVRRINADYPITWEQVLDQTRPGIAVGRPHLADALIAREYFQDRKEVFTKVLHTASPYYVRYQSIDTIACVRTIRQAHGVPVFAHPRALSRQRRFIAPATIQKMKQAGLFGLEVEHPEQPPAARAEVAGYARRFQLHQTGASDYHGRGKPNRLGECLTSEAVFAELCRQGRLPVLYP